MIDQVEELEKHVGALLSRLEASHRKMTEINRENEELRRQIDQLLNVKKNNDQLQNQVHQLEGEVESMAGKESQIRERLQAILSKIDTIENELTASGGAE